MRRVTPVACAGSNHLSILIVMVHLKKDITAEVFADVRVSGEVRSSYVSMARVEGKDDVRGIDMDNMSCKRCLSLMDESEVQEKFPIRTYSEVVHRGNTMDSNPLKGNRIVENGIKDTSDHTLPDSKAPRSKQMSKIKVINNFRSQVSSKSL
ncbi:hypothetical protein Droror1_Dr00024554 [Drosera rotundifolia]